MRLKIMTPDRVLIDQDVEAVYAMAIDGSIGILPKHIPMVTPLAIGLLSYVVQGGPKEPLAVMGGMLSTDGQTVTVLSDAAERGNEIDVARAQQAKARAEAELRQKQEHYDATDVDQALSRAVTRLKAARH
jgi:F-type H+-transporting ATPase subunit epsilon